jgi:hypothetical protein
MMKVIAEQEHYLLISDGEHFSAVERRAGKSYPLCSGLRRGLDDETAAQLVRESGSYSESDARKLLADVASQWRDLFEHVR